MQQEEVKGKCVAGILRGLGGLFGFRWGVNREAVGTLALVVAGEPRSWACKSTNCVHLTQSGIFQMNICLRVQGSFEKQGFSMRSGRTSLPQEVRAGDSFYPGVFPSSSSAVRSRLNQLRGPISQFKVNSCEELSLREVML